MRLIAPFHTARANGQYLSARWNEHVMTTFLTRPDNPRGDPKPVPTPQRLARFTKPRDTAMAGQ